MSGISTSKNRNYAYLGKQLSVFESLNRTSSRSDVGNVEGFQVH